MIGILGLLFSFSSGGAQQSPDLASILQEIWEFELREDPIRATRIGDHRFNDRLAEVSLAAMNRRHRQREEFLDRLHAFPTDALDDEDRLNLDIQIKLLENDVAEHGFHSHVVPITNRDGFHVEFPELRRKVPLNNETDYRNYIQRLRQFGAYTDGHIELMREGIRQRITLPSVVLHGFEQPIEAQIVDPPERSLLFQPLAKLPSTIPPAAAEELRDAARQAIRESVVPGYATFLKFMREEYVPQARETIGARSLPHGREFYQHRVHWFTTLDLTPDQVHATGLSEVARIRKEMEQVKQRAGFDGTLDAFIEFLRTDPKFYVSSKDELLQITALVLKRMDGELPKLFRVLPRAPYGVREIPAYIAPLTTTAYYQAPPGDATDAGYYYVNTFNLKSRPTYEIEALSLHEAVPGHHLQIALQQELESLPPFRRFAGFTAFVEGWALYAERLGMEVGFYTDPYSDFGRLTFEMWRACRLVVDTGIHALGWSREQAIEFMEANTALSKHNIRAEVDRYISWPGQALAYKIGELKIRELRSYAESTLKGRFDVREFHDVVLSAGAVPLSTLEARVHAYVGRKGLRPADKLTRP